MTQAVTPELLACPFCGGKARWVDDTGAVNTPFGLVVDHVAGCFMQPSDYTFDQSKIITAWNTRIASASAPAGWKLVPVEPTIEMLGAVYPLRDFAYGRENWYGMVNAAPVDEPAMLTAAPQPQG